ncbi:AAA family ATPase [Neptunomonas concharum]|uniref:AAA family ATPase n=1 Tax=Neptunomonas concharum TaxID=1031538 RepID=A0A5P1REA2_9GAMM|nr:bifunctional aminoglycoside phosphotransferase/ATP-binding protein [Neptunomonas concharum]QEQ97937.1 AAA family ATPase [Neptunomonas concharum]
MQPDLIKALTRPEHYPHHVDSPVRVIETHISWLLLTGEYAYKIKKPVDFGFLDFTTLALRKHFCEEELRLNQRLAPDIYDTLIAITGSVDNPQLNELDQLDEATPIEYAVRMYQFDPELRLDLILDRRRFEPAWIDMLAEQIAHFHTRIPRVAQDSPWGEPDTIWDVVSDNYTHISEQKISSNDWQQLQFLSHRTAQQFRKLAPVIARRKQEGHIRECHGDLHLGNVTLYHGQLRLFDCIEFNLQFRWIDTICDLAFLLMDLEVKGQYRWSNRCLNRYLELTGDYESLSLLNFYKSYRSMVRAKVAMLGDTPDLTTFRRYLNLTQQYTHKQKPALFLMHGVSGSGKSHLSSQLVERIDCIRLRSDVERKRLYRELSRRGERLELYGQEMNARTFQHLLNLSRSLLQSGYSVIVDATFIRKRTRVSYADLAQSLEIPLRIISCHCEQKLIEARLKRRQAQGGDASDADIKVMQDQLKHQQRLTEAEQDYTIAVDTDDDDAINVLLSQMIAEGLIAP